ncbi:uncharacterized protein [Diadema antillarum]|uniref:uncharacterized protein n=1 Tax=Diadema antillarum TaxID=105358 RepID=UPI003A87CFE5
MPIIDAKLAALVENKRSPNEKSLQALRVTRGKVQQTARRCANEYWQQLSNDIQTAAATGNIKRMYEGIKCALGPAQTKTAPLKSASGEVITDKENRWRDWLSTKSELYSKENVVVYSVLDSIVPLPVMEELDVDPAQEELCKAIDSLTCGKAPGNDGIPPDLIKCLLKNAFGTSNEWVYLHTRSDGRLFNLARLRAKTKIRVVLIRDVLFADDAEVTSHTEQGLQFLMDRHQACKDFGLTISLKKTNVLGQDVDTPPVITVDNYKLDVVPKFTYLGSTISEDPSLDVALGRQRLHLATNDTSLEESQANDNKDGSSYKLNGFHLRSLRRILGINWIDKVSNAKVLDRAGLPTMYTLIRKHRLHWLGHVRRMDDGRIPKDILYGELASGKRSIGRPPS